MKRIMILFITTWFLLPSMNSSAATNFPDVKEDFWAYDEIHFLVENQIIRGYKDGNFGPNDPIKRMQAAEMLVKGLGLSTENRPNPNFKDLKPGDYGYEYAATLADEGIMTGSNGYFKPWDTLTRGQMAKILAEAYDLLYVYDSEFTDVPYDHWAYDYVSSLFDNHITTGYPDATYRPNGNLTRAQFAAFMARILNDSFKQTVLINPINYEWDQEGGLTLLVEFKNNFDYPVELRDTMVAVTADGEIIAEGLFEFTADEFSLKAKDTAQIGLYFSPDLVYYVTEMNNIKLYSHTNFVKN
ncbi:MAG: S-layer homology domain-containing protein [Bacillus sp. (in: Bacteria)]|jgi:hypothetical protein|nr:S-layer homology domain-containing protein [Bacillus sp. (in: firmicutes)]